MSEREMSGVLFDCTDRNKTNIGSLKAFGDLLGSHGHPGLWPPNRVE